MSELYGSRHRLPDRYFSRRELGAAEQWKAVCVGATAGVVAYDITRLVLGRALLPCGGAPATLRPDGAGAERLLSPSTTGTART